MLLATDFVPPCIPTQADKAPVGPGWVHDIKHDGYRLQVRRNGDVVRLFTRRCYDWSRRYPAIVATAAELRATSFTVDGFDALHRRGTVSEAMLYEFDLLEQDGEDLRALSLRHRKTRQARVLARRRLGIVLTNSGRRRRHDTPAGLKMGLEGTVSKRLSALGPNAADARISNCEAK